MSVFGLIGYPLQHSFSKKYFEEKFKQEGLTGNKYHEWPLKSIDDFPRLIKSLPDVKGLNVTIPYKELVIPFLDELDEVAVGVKAVNCIKVANGKWKGYNTDVIGLKLSLRNFLTGAPPAYAFILGTGGSAKAAMFVLNKLSIPFSVVSTRNAAEYIRYNQIAGYMKTSNLFINATPLGTFPDINTAPEIPYSSLTEKDFLFDLVYNPSETLFMKQGKIKGAKTKNGLEMLHIQAEKSWEIWAS